jgi:hypothetical protein
MQAQIDSVIPLKSKPTISSVPVSPSVSNIVNKAEGEQVEPTDYEEGSGVPTGTPTDTSAKVKCITLKLLNYTGGNISKRDETKGPLTPMEKL